LTSAKPDLSRLALREEAVGDAALVENLDRARVQTTGARAVELLTGAPLDDRDIHLCQRQLRRQHHAGRTSAGDQDRMHSLPPSSVGFRLRPAILRHFGGLVSSPPTGYKLEVERGWEALSFSL
jgi:hypothetical protein